MAKGDQEERRSHKRWADDDYSSYHELYEEDSKGVQILIRKEPVPAMDRIPKALALKNLNIMKLDNPSRTQELDDIALEIENLRV